MDDDAGTMSSWYIWSTLGLYPLIPGTPHYAATAALVPRARLQLPGTAPVMIRPSTTGGAMIAHEAILAAPVSSGRPAARH